MLEYLIVLDHLTGILSFHASRPSIFWKFGRLCYKAEDSMIIMLMVTTQLQPTVGLDHICDILDLSFFIYSLIIDLFVYFV